MEIVERLILSTVFPIKLIIGIFFFSPMLIKRPCFWLRGVLCIFALFGVSFAAGGYFLNFDAVFIADMVQFVFIMISIFICYQASVTTIFFVSGLILSIQQITFNLVTFFYIPYYNSLKANSQSLMEETITNCIHIPIAALAFWIFTKWFFKKFIVNEEVIIRNKTVIFVDFSLVFSIFVLFHFAYGTLMKYNHVVEGDVYGYLYLLVSICCILSVGYFISIFTKEQTDVKMEIMQNILRETTAQHNIFKENIDIINRKSHDLKFMISSLSKEGHEAYIEELKHAVDIYESVPKTGNVVLDVVLSENILRAKEAGVEITCIADGRQLNYMDEADLYALFGNIISNAIEAAVKAEPEKRYIHLVIGEIKGNLVSITVENGYNGEIRMKEGLPLTSKGDIENHGFGMKSIDYIVKKYGGGLDIRFTEDIFKISIILEQSKSIDEK